ncbi:MAG: hypothetical protein MI923_15415 [Phycisphaerales bacterium]|nr:hypothetical protein [Phycisphaerales bacterium]
MSSFRPEKHEHLDRPSALWWVAGFESFDPRRVERRDDEVKTSTWAS